MRKVKEMAAGKLVNETQPKLPKLLANVAAIYIGLCVLAAAFCWSTGKPTLGAIGNALIYLGVGLTAAGVLVNFNRSGNSFKTIETYQKWQVRTNDAISDWTMRVMLASILLAISGLILIHLAACGRLYCG